MSDIYDLGKVNGFVIEDIFNGNAGTLNATYTFSKPITDYKLIIFFSAVNNSTFANSNKNSMVVLVSDIIGNLDSEYRNYVHNGSVAYSVSIKIDINNNNFTINQATCGDGWSNSKIYKVIGIR